MVPQTAIELEKKNEFYDQGKKYHLVRVSALK